MAKKPLLFWVAFVHVLDSSSPACLARESMAVLGTSVCFEVTSSPSLGVHRPAPSSLTAFAQMPLVHFLKFHSSIWLECIEFLSALNRCRTVPPVPFYLAGLLGGTIVWYALPSYSLYLHQMHG